MLSKIVKKALNTKTVSFLVMGSMLPMTTACEDHEIAVGAAIIAAGAAVSASNSRHHRHHRRDDYRRSRRHYDSRDSYRRDHHRRDRYERRGNRRSNHFNEFFTLAAATDASPTKFRALAETSSTLVEEATVQDYMQAYKLSEQGALTLQQAVKEADGGYLESLEDLGLNASDIKDLSTVYRVTDKESIQRLANSLGQKVFETKSMLHKMAMYARDMRLEACDADPDHFDSICR